MDYGKYRGSYLREGSVESVVNIGVREGASALRSIMVLFGQMDVQRK